MGCLEEGRVVRGQKGDYHVERRLGKSRHHTLYLARMAGGRGPSDRLVLMKELHASDIREWSDIERLRGEARLLEDFRYARVPELVELFATNGERPEAADRFTERFVRASDGVVTPASRDATASDEGEKLPSLVLVRTWVSGETAEEAAARGRPFTPAQLEDVLRDLLALVGSLHALVPEVVHGEIDATRVVLDGASRAHLIGFGGGAMRRKPNASADVEPARPSDDLRGIARVIERLAGDGALARSGLSPRAIEVVQALGAAKPRVDRARAALAMLTEPAPPSALRRIARSKVLRVATLAIVSVSVHGAILGSVLRSANRKANAATPMAAPKAAVKPSATVPAAPPPPPPRPTPPSVIWTGQVIESSDVLVQKGATCVMTADVSGSAEQATCSVSLTCGSAVLVQNESASNCEVIEQSTPTGAEQYKMKASKIGPDDGLSLRIDHGSAYVFSDGTVVRVQLAATSNALRWSGDRRLGGSARPLGSPREFAGVAVKAVGDANVHSGDQCTLRFRPLATDVLKSCNVRVECRGNVLYDRDTSCTNGGMYPEYVDSTASVIDGDATVSWDDQLLTLEDLTPQGRKHVEIYLLEPKHME